ncbi:succinate dehydrogenase cytochrome b560 subunit, mitochondrial-like [Oratosquilla oratoria]|uniref:succinate dehydrogenase cytochrome b560 subunit, mitochondrial-like n=1 Tax=Oratosquilla oratoria TaxID=337810 RepID=UPI003F76A942
MLLALRLITRGCNGGTLQTQGISKVFGPRPQWARALYTSPSVAAMKVQTAEDFWAKNKRLKRPISPHMTIYKPQITSILSLSHRASGIMLSGVISGFGIGMLALPGSYPYYLEMVQNMQFGSVLIFAAKFSLALPFMYHICNGIRHLVWDLGYGFTLRTLYKTGYLVVITSIILSIIVSLL